MYTIVASLLYCCCASQGSTKLPGLTFECIPPSLRKNSMDGGQLRWNEAIAAKLL
jgi:hypothetical protein